MKSKTSKHTDYSDFEVGDRVKVVSEWVDMRAIPDNMTGVVVRNMQRYLGIIVKFDTPLRYISGPAVIEFNFNPQNLEHLEASNVAPTERQHLEHEQAAAQAIQPEPVPLIAAFQALTELCHYESDWRFSISQIVILRSNGKGKEELFLDYMVMIKRVNDSYVTRQIEALLPDAIWAAIEAVKAASQ